MNISCAICHDELEKCNDIFGTPCGHVFHFPCLILWLEKAQTCPQCRRKVKRDSITRLYFNFSNTEIVKEDSFTLQQKVDTLSFQIKLKETEYKNCSEENVVLKRQNSGLRDEVKKTESEINQKNSVIYALKEQSQYFKRKCQDFEKIQEEKIKLENKLETYENVKILVCSTSEEVDKMLSRTTDIPTFCTYISIMKRELSTSLEKRKELRSTVKTLQQRLQTLKMEKNSFSQNYTKQIEQLENELSLCQNEKGMLQKRLGELESKDKNSDNLLDEASKPCSENVSSRKRESVEATDIDSVSSKKFQGGTTIMVSSVTKKTKENEENSPYLPTKSKSILALKSQASQRSTFPIKSKQLSSKKSSSLNYNSEQDSDTVFDGFGGHSKMDVFPISNPTSNKLKRPANQLSKNKKIKLNFGGNKQLDDYIINLT
ncbi:PREDICTED: E3 ubiquitin-protein ligase TRAIP [Ceratosolen solmsi marchali]|uniref:E3 ubiquitin-protein ligase TRAIP n=1 Tax=Ceratosolen solmsi marchali TaxID=326594 RepID=A0AAJ6YQZ4_9HYME|nr:PREDICTED: E3 ubiquitin-protein ligase TRAIP [Ceratosolen solmsi marchali]